MKLKTKKKVPGGEKFRQMSTHKANRLDVDAIKRMMNSRSFRGDTLIRQIISFGDTRIYIYSGMSKALNLR
jgi:hypothetical protein